MPSATTAPAASRPFQRARTSPRGNSPSAMVTSRVPSWIAIRKWSARRSENWMLAACESHSQTGEKILATRVCEIGLGSSFKRCVTAKAVAVAVSKISARTVGALRLTAARLYAEPEEERGEAEADPDRDDIARVGHVEQLDPAQREDAREAEPQSVLRQPEREAARHPDPRHRPQQQPRHRVEVDVALHEVSEARDPQQRGGVEDVRADDLRDRQRIDHHHHEAEERAAADGGEPDDEAEDGPEQHRPNLVLPLHDERRVTGLDAPFDECLGNEARRAEHERGPDRVALCGLDTVAVRVLQPAGDGDTEQRHRARTGEHPERQMPVHRSEPPVADGAERLEDRAVEDVGADRIG